MDQIDSVILLSVSDILLSVVQCSVILHIHFLYCKLLYCTVLYLTELFCSISQVEVTPLAPTAVTSTPDRRSRTKGSSHSAKSVAKEEPAVVTVPGVASIVKPTRAVAVAGVDKRSAKGTAVFGSLEVRILKTRSLV